MPSKIPTIPIMNPKSLLACLLGITLIGIPAAHATLTVTNGDFETGGGSNIENVTGWNDSGGAFWQGTWQTNSGAITPNGTNVVVLGSYESGAIRNTASADANVGNFLYQSVGTAEPGQTALQVNFQFGQPDDDPGGRTVGVTVGVYAYDGLGGFAEGDATDVRGASGVTFLGSQSFSLVSTDANDVISAKTANFPIPAEQIGKQLFLRFNNYRPDNTESWSVVDNVTVTGLTSIPNFVTQPALNTFANVGGNVTLSASATGDPAPTYQWKYSVDGNPPFTDVLNGGSISGADTNTLTLNPAAYSQSGYYRVVATNINGSTNSNNASVSLSYPNPGVSGPASSVVLAGQTATFAVTATGLGNLSYKWFKVDGGGDIELTNGGDISGATTASLQISNVATADAGGYYVIVSDDAAVADLLPPTTTTSATATLTIADVQVTASATAPSTDAFDPSYLPGNVDDVDNIGGTGVSPLDNDASTYASFDRASQGMTFTTGSDPLGYSIQSVTVQMVQVINYLTNGTFYNIQPGNTFEFQFGSVTGGVKTPLFDTNGALYSGTAMVNPSPPANTGAGNYLTFDLATAGIGTLSPNTTYYFEISSELGAPFFELSGTKVDGYTGGTAFRGDTIGTIDANYVALTGDRAFHADLTGLSGPSNTYASWISGYPGVGLKTGFNDDADGDGIDNGLENLFGTNPSVSNQGIVQVAKSGNTITFQHPASTTPASDVTPAYVWSTDLATFQADGASAGGTTVAFSTNTVANVTTVTATITGTVPAKLFTVLKAVKSP